MTGEAGCVERGAAEYWERQRRVAAVFRAHFGSETPLGDDRFEAEWITQTFSWGWRDAWNHDDELLKLETLERALLALTRFGNLTERIFTVLMLDASERSKGFKEDISPGHFEISPYHALIAAFDLHDLLAPSIRAAKSAVPTGGHRSGKVKWEAVAAIDACRTSWWRCTGDEAPVSLNPASKFGKFVQDIFYAMEVDGTPRAAMDSWRRVQSKDENT